MKSNFNLKKEKMKIWIVFTPRQTYLNGSLVIPKVFVSEREACMYWEQMNIRLTADHEEQNKKGNVFRPGVPEFLHICEQEI